jgi:deazaflavin-dependent oxidoreductase (nitroreductase family)
MSVQVPPRGTKGPSMPPRLLGPIFRFGMRQLVNRYRRRRGQMTLNGQPLVLLRTVGAKSGEIREVLLNRFPDDGSTNSWIVTATAGGAAAHPAWFRNMARHPDQVWLEINERLIHVRPETFSGSERDAAWQGIVELIPSFGSYPKKTDRLIPVVRLTAID